MSAVQAWEAFLLHSLATRLDPETFTSYLDILTSEHPLHPLYISEIFLRPSDYNRSSLDPRVPRYVEILLLRDLISIPHILRALRKYSAHQGREKDTNAVESAPEDGAVKSKDNGAKDVGLRARWSSSAASEEAIFYRLAKRIHGGHGPDSRREALDILRAVNSWMDAAISTQQQANSILNISVTDTHESNAQAIALAALVVAVVENDQVQQALKKGKEAVSIGKELTSLLENFIPLFLQSSPQSAARLSVFRNQTLPAILPAEKKVKDNTVSGEIDALIGEGLGVESVVVQELPAVNSRAGLYVYLNALVILSFLLSTLHRELTCGSLLQDLSLMIHQYMHIYTIATR